MAKSNVFLLLMFLMASLSSTSHSLTLFGIPIGRIRIRGFLGCSLTGDPFAPPVSNATVYLQCGGQNATLAQTTTDPLGFFTLVLNVVETLLVSPSQCFVEANFPTGSCNIYPPDGTLEASVHLVNITVTSLVNIAEYAASAFFNRDVNA